jgi:transglutaminase-like putative cysteine protease
MRFERLLDRLTGGVVLLAILTYALAAGSAMIAMVALPASIGAWLLGDHLRSMTVPRIAANALVLAAVARALYQAFQRGVRVEDVCLLVVLILIIKLFDRKSARDYAQLLTLSIFLSLGAVLTSNAFLMGLVLIAMLPLVIGAATVFQLFTAWEQRGGDRQPASARVSGASPGRDLWRLVSLATTGAACVAIGAFLLLPRGIGADALGRMARPSTGTQTGFSSTVDLGRGGLISESPAVVMDLALYRVDTNEPIGESGIVYYLRGAVLDEYQAGRWTRSGFADRRSSGPIDAESGDKVQITEVPVDTPDDAKIAQRVSIRKTGKNEEPIFTLWQPIVISFDERTGFRRDAYDKSLRVQGRGGRLEYTVVSLVSDMRPVDQTRRTYRAMPVAPGVHDVAVTILEDRDIDPDPETRPVQQDGRAARAIQDYLQLNFTYTLDVLAAPPERDPVEWFLSEARQGHCEYFASAMALMCRSVGIDARVVTGYVAAEFNSATGHYIVRESNAHAWVEAEEFPGRWTRYDPTPPTELDRIHRPALGLIGRFKQWFSALEYAWINSVVSYDQRNHERIDRAEGSPMGVSGGAVSDFFRNIESGGMELWFKALFVGIMAFAACAAALTVMEAAYRTLAEVFSRRRIRQQQVAADPDLPRRIEQMGVYADLLRAMARAGHAKPSHKPPRLHAESIGGVAPAASVAAQRVVDWFYLIRFGRRVLTPEELLQASESVRAFEHAMRGRSRG